MSRKLDWRRARPRRETEHKLGENVTLANGERTPAILKDKLRQQAERAMRDWSRTLTLKERKQLQEVSDV